MKFVDLIHEIYEKKESYENMEDVVEILNDLFHELKQHNIEMYDKYIDELKSILYHVSENEAHIIVKNMKPYGEKWDFETIKNFISSKGIDNHLTEYYLVMNMGYNDHHDLAKMVEKAEDAEFYFEFAKEFICDVDGKPYKVAKYFLQ